MHVFYTEATSNRGYEFHSKLFKTTIQINIERTIKRWYFGYKTQRNTAGVRRHPYCLQEGYKTKREAKDAMEGWI